MDKLFQIGSFCVSILSPKEGGRQFHFPLRLSISI